MESRKCAIGISLLIISLGIAWLLNSMGIIPRVDWIWVAGLGVSGLLLLTLGGLERFNFVVGITLIVASILSVLRQTGVLETRIEAPVLFITVGVLMLLAYILKIPGTKNESNTHPQ